MRGGDILIICYAGFNTVRKYSLALLPTRAGGTER